MKVQLSTVRVLLNILKSIYELMLPTLIASSHLNAS